MIHEFLFGHGPIPVLKKSIAFARLRNRQIALNVANAETPGYLARDLPVRRFEEILRDSLVDGDPGKGFVFREQGGIRVGKNGMLEAPVILDPKAGPVRHNGNNVDLEQEMVKLAMNSGRHSTMIELLDQQLDLLEVAAGFRGR